ncbi:MAG: acyltransferase [Lachnospiraceae bacterium]|nr:acyltransferase [Lachnospiraceae bacterium]
MDKLIYLIYPIMIIILFAGAKVCKRKEWNEEFMSLSQTKALQGFFAICIMLHHAGQKTCASWKPAPFIVHGLDFFVPIGYFFVGVFLFCSGYGLYKSFTQKEDYLRGFGKRRVLPLVLAFYSTAIIFFIVRLIMGERMNPGKIFCYLSGAMLCNPNAWFVIALPIFYLFFYLAFRFIKKTDAALAVTCFMVFVYTVIGTFIDHNDYWMQGEWWYNSVHLFSIGMLFARFEKPLMAHLKKYYAVYLILMIVGLAVLYPFSEYAQTAFSYYGQNWGAPDKVPRRWVCLISQAGAACAFVFLVFLLNMKIRIGNRILKFMGTITMEFYLIHGLFVELFGYSFLDLRATMGYVRGYYIRNVALYLVVVTILSVPAACLLQKLHKKILG